MSRKPSFEQALSNLIGHLRGESGDDATTRRLLSDLRREITGEGVVTEAGVELADTLNDPGLIGCMHRRRIERITVEREATADELLELARALVTEDRPIPETDKVRIAFVVDITPGEAMDRQASRPSENTGEIPLVKGFDAEDDRPPRLPDGAADELGRLARAIREGEGSGSWTEALHAAQAVAHLAARAPSGGRRLMAIAGRRLLSRKLMRGFIDHAVRVPEERPRVIQLLGWIGRDAAEVVIDSLAENEAIGPKAFLCDLAAGLPDAYPLMEALLKSPEWHRACLGADLLGRRSQPDAVGVLAAQAGHRDSRVRLAVVTALGQIDDPATAEPLLASLSDTEATVRAAAARSLGGRSSRGVTMALARSLQSDRDSAARIATIEALGGIGTSEAANVLSAVATTGRTLFNRRGYTLDQRLASVVALSQCRTHSAELALERVARLTRGRVARAASRALEDRAPRAQPDRSILG